MILPLVKYVASTLMNMPKKKSITITICPECRGIANMNETISTIIIARLCATHKIMTNVKYEKI